MISRRTAICLMVIGLSAVASIGSAAALDYPTRPVRWVVGYPPGGATDIIARLIGHRLSEKLGQQFVIENKPGAGNNIATEAVVNAEPDGYTVLLVNPANYINASLYANLKFNFVRDIAPLMLRINAGAYSFEVANPRHQHECKIWRDIPLPDGKILIPGLLGHASNYVEHPELIADMIELYAGVVGKENVIAGADCGFSSRASFHPEVHPTVVWEKFRALA